ncbi:MAG: 3-deoxy-manno-octulosonate cytidylyltransferase [bacterium]
MPEKDGIVGVIPARYGSTRFPGKPLVTIAGKTMIQRVYERASAARLLSSVMVATDDERIEECVLGFGGKVVMTSKRNPTGTDRVAEVAEKIVAPYYVNIQGDEPLINPEHIDLCANLLLAGSEMSTLVAPIEDEMEVFNPNVVKVVVSESGSALMFSRAAIPYPRDYFQNGDRSSFDISIYLRHIGIYGYTFDTLKRIKVAGPCFLERIESLEQLRALWLGIEIKVARVEKAGLCVDVPADVEKIERAIEIGEL